MTQTSWVQDIISKADISAAKPFELLIFIHGYNNAPKEILKRHRLLNGHIERLGLNGMIMSFDWPSDTSFSNYDEDILDGLDVMYHLWQDCIHLFHAHSDININLIAHSVGAHLTLNSIDKASAFKAAVNHTFFLGADIHYKALLSSNFEAYTTRITNYYMPHDKSLLFSYIMQHYLLHKRAGRVSLFGSDVVNLNCIEHFKTLAPPKNPLKYISHTHSWYFNSFEVLKDIVLTLQGKALHHRKIKNGEYYL